MATTQQLETAPGTLVRSSPVARSIRLRGVKNFFTAMLFLLPSLVIFTAYVFVPLVKTIDLSTFLTDAIGRPVERTWLENYQTIFSEPDLLNSLKVSLTFALYVVPITLIVSLFLAVLSNQQLRGIS